MKKNEAILLVLPFITFLLCACNQDDPIKNPYSVFQKEYRTHGEEYEDEYYGYLTSCRILQFDKPNKADFYDFVRSLEAAEKSLAQNGNVLILNQDSPLVELFYGK